jgi:hypothetical protein
VFSKKFRAAGRMPERIGLSYHFILSSTARLTPTFGAFSIYLPFSLSEIVHSDLLDQISHVPTVLLYHLGPTSSFNISFALSSDR